MYRVLLRPKALKQLKKLDKKEQKKVRQAIDYLEADPFAGKKMGGAYIGRYSLRSWPYRVIYRIEKRKVVVVVLAIGHRQGIYK